MTDQSAYTPPKIWKWEAESGGTFEGSLGGNDVEDFYQYDAAAATGSGAGGNEAKSATTFSELPINARRLLGFLSQSLAPINMITHGPDLKDFIKWNI